MTRPAAAAVILSVQLAVAAWADETPPAIRVVGRTVYTLDAKGHTTGTVREISPGLWHQRDMKGNLVRAMEIPVGCTPFIPCRSKKPGERD